MNILVKIILGIACSLLPFLVFGADLEPTGSGDNAWALYVMGNGYAVDEILTAIKLMMSNDGFRTMLLFVGTVGIAIVGTMAGFNPGQYLGKFVAFFVTAFIVITISLNVKSTVMVQDKVNGYYNTVTDVPAIVAVPASVVSQTGEWLTRKIEANFTLPGSMTLSGGGYYNIANKLMADSGKLVITNADLKQSISNYMGDCVVPMLARQEITVDQIMKSPNLWETVKWDHPSVYTKYFAVKDPSITVAKSMDPSKGTTGGNALPAQDLGELKGTKKTGLLSNFMGELVSCRVAYERITEDMATYASMLQEANALAWGSTGTMVPLEAVTADTFTYLTNSSVSNPAGAIKQRVVLNSITGTFRDAAMRTGNNELLTNMAVTTAEQTQKTTWVVAGEIFNNMMGYVYTTLQAFIFAIAPIIVIAALIPGFGRTIFVNYGQIMLWLALWQPMLSIVNFLIMIFSKNAIGGVLGASQGFTMANNALITEQANGMMTASQFLGTMVPLLTWGLVKGAMAFTEFISHGMGGSLASQAGKEAATGNYQLNNMSMDNFSANKFDASSKSTVGFQDVNSFLNAGAGQATSNQGGFGQTANAGAYSMKESNSGNAGYARKEDTTVGDKTDAGNQRSGGREWGGSESKVHSTSDGTGKSSSRTEAGASSETKTDSAGNTVGTSDGHKVSTGGSHKEQVGSEASIGTKVGATSGSSGGAPAGSGGATVQGAGGAAVAGVGAGSTQGGTAQALSAAGGQLSQAAQNAMPGGGKKGSSLKPGGSIGGDVTAGDSTGSDRSASRDNGASQSTSAGTTFAGAQSASVTRQKQDSASHSDSVSGTTSATSGASGSDKGSFGTGASVSHSASEGWSSGASYSVSMDRPIAFNPYMEDYCFGNAATQLDSGANAGYLATQQAMYDRFGTEAASASDKINSSQGMFAGNSSAIAGIAGGYIKADSYGTALNMGSLAKTRENYAGAVNTHAEGIQGLTNYNMGVYKDIANDTVGFKGVALDTRNPETGAYGLGPATTDYSRGFKTAGASIGVVGGIVADVIQMKKAR